MHPSLIVQLELKEKEDQELPEIKLHIYKADMLNAIVEVDHNGNICKPNLSPLDPTGAPVHVPYPCVSPAPLCRAHFLRHPNCVWALKPACGHCILMPVRSCTLAHTQAHMSTQGGRTNVQKGELNCEPLLLLTGFLFGCGSRTMMRRPLKHYIDLGGKPPDSLLKDDMVS